MKRTNQYELKIVGKKESVIWEGTSGLDACKYYAETHPGETVIAWRNYPQHGVFVVDARQVVG